MSAHPQSNAAPASLNQIRKPMHIAQLSHMHKMKEPIAMLTCYDSSFAGLMDVVGLDCVLIGDSLGMVVQGNSSTLGVSIDDMAYHTRCVARRIELAWIMTDMPFGSYHTSLDQTMRNATTLVQAGAQMVKLEGGGWTAEAIHFLVERGIPVCAHLGLTPQSVHALGGYRLQGKTPEAANKIITEAKALVDAGANMLLLELVPATLGAEITSQLPIPVIGIGAGNACSGQVLVLPDMLGITPRVPKFVRNFMLGQNSIEAALRQYVHDVKTRAFPDDSLHSY